jgi:hypothetical protein
MSNKNEATWHPNDGPVTVHDELIARLRAIVDVTDDEYEDIDRAANVIRRLSDSVPRESYRALHDQHEATRTHRETAERERDEALVVIEQASHAPGCRWDRIDARRGPDACTCWKSKAPADALARHDAEVKAQALDEAAVEARRKWEPYSCPWVGFLDDRAAAIRAEAK